MVRPIISGFCGVAIAILLSLSPARAQEEVRQIQARGAIREKPPGELATVLRRDPDFGTIKFLGMQRDYREELRSKLMMSHSAIRNGRPVIPMEPIVWPPEVSP